MKNFKALLAIAAAALIGFSSCDKKEEDLGTPSVSIDSQEVTIGPESGAEATVSITATRDWSVTSKPEWLQVEPDKGKASASATKVTITAKANEGIDRQGKVVFSIGFGEAVLTVKQRGASGSVEEALLYKNNFDKEDTANNNGWPYLDATECWKNEEGNAVAGLKYEFSGMSVRNNGQQSDNQNSLYKGSGRNFLFFGKTSTFAVKEIALGGKTNFTLSFIGERYTQDDSDNTFNFDEFKVYISNDGIKGVEVTPTFASGHNPVGVWDLASVGFSVPAGTEKLTVAFKCDKLNTKSSGGVYRMDDLQLIASAATGDVLDFSKGVALGLDASDLIEDTDEVTDLSTIVSNPSGTQVQIYNTPVTAVTTRGYVISDGTTTLYVYKNAAPSVNVGDKVSIIGTFKYYWGEYELVDASEKVTGTVTVSYPNPVELNANILNAAKAAAPADEESTGFKGPWYPYYVHFSATVKKNGNYTNFIVEGIGNDYISLTNAPSSMFKDASGTDFGEGDNVEVLGYYAGWEGKNQYHQVIAVSVTGEATYVPVQAAVAGDDVFIAANEAHDRNVENGVAFNNPVVVGDASISFLGGGNNGKFYNTGTAVRIYKEGSVEITSSRTIEKVEYLFGPNDSSNSYSPAQNDLGSLFDNFTPTWNSDTRILAWTGSANTVTLKYPLSSGHYRIQQIGVTYGEDVEARLAVSPDAISVKADVTSTKFNVQSNVSWSIQSDNSAFVANPASGQGNAEVTVTFPANESLENDVVAHLTVSASNVDDAVVTITQAKAIDGSQVTDLSEIWKKEDGTAVELYNVVVSAVTYKNFIVTDGTTAVYIFANNASHGRKIGDKLNITGSTKWYYGLLEIENASVSVVSEGNDVVYPDPVELTGDVLNNTYAQSANNSPVYAKFTAVTTVSGNYLQFTPAGASNYISFTDLPNAEKEKFTEGQTVTVYGYYGSWNSKNSYHQFYYVKHEVVGEAAPFLRADKTEISVAASATEATINVSSNVAWTAAAGTGASVTPAEGQGNGSVKVSFPANEDTENAKTYTVTISSSNLDDVVVTITQAKAASQGGGDGTTVTVSMLEWATNNNATTNQTQVTSIELTSGITMSVNGDGNNGKFYSNGAEWRLYQTNKAVVTISATGGKELVSVKFTYTVTNGGVLLDALGAQVASGQVSACASGATSAAYTVASTTGATNGQVRISAVEVVYK